MLEIYRGDGRLMSHLLLPGTVTNKYQSNDAYLPEAQLAGVEPGSDR